MLAQFFSTIFDFIQNALQAALRWIGSLLGYLLDKLFAFLRLLFMPILILVGMIFYFFYKVAALLLKLLHVLLAIGKLVYALLKGIAATIAGLTYQAPATPDHGSWTPMIEQVTGGLESFQLDKIAYVLLFVIWISTAYAAVQILTGGSGDE